MFQPLRPAIAERMRQLEERDTQERGDGTPRLKRLRQIPPETGKFLALLAANAPGGHIIEIGTSAGYSTLWLVLAAAVTGRRVTTFEVLPEKVAMARETFRLAGVGNEVALIEGDARSHIAKFEAIAFCFLDVEKEAYEEIYEAVIPRLVKGGILVADNAISHRDALAPVLERALGDERVDALIVPVGKGVLVCRRV